MSLLDEARLIARVSDDTFDPEIIAHVAAALTDMRRAGVREDLLDPSLVDPFVKEAVFLYLRANFGYDVNEAQRFKESYNQVVADLLNSSANECADSERAANVSGFAQYVQGALSSKE